MQAIKCLNMKELCRGYDVFYHADKKECDFVVREGMRINAAYQVTIAMNDEKNMLRLMASRFIFFLHGNGCIEG